MTKLYSKTTKGFYDSEIHKIMPEDAVTITDEQYQSLLAQQSQGMAIIPDSSGMPTTQKLLLSAASKTNLYKQAAARALKKADMVAIRCLKAGVEYPVVWHNYDIALRAIISNTSPDTTKPLPTAPPYPVGT
jgi:hypothetical protein